MGIVNRFFVPELTNQPNRQHAVEVYAADDIGFPEKQVKEQPGIVFGIKAGPGFKKTIQPLLIIFFPAEWRGRGLLNPGKCNRITCIGQAGTDAYHALVVVEVVGNSKYYLFQIARFGMACPFNMLPKGAGLGSRDLSNSISSPPGSPRKSFNAAYCLCLGNIQKKSLINRLKTNISTYFCVR